MTTLGIETSCDETALALIETRGGAGEKAGIKVRVIDSLVHSQADLHSAYGGVFPTLAKREHGKNLVPLLEKLLRGSGIFSDLERKIDSEIFASHFEKFKKENEGQNPELMASFESADFLRNVPKIDQIAVTEGPGLEPTLWTGITFARMLAEIWNIPLIPVNHMEGHVVGSLFDADAPFGTWQSVKGTNQTNQTEGAIFPALALLISGGHTELVKMSGFGRYEIIGQTKDDAVGEAFDKAARLLGLPYPGGPHISKLAGEARQNNIQPPVKLPRPMMTSGDLDFSFSGLKTAVLYAIRDALSGSAALPGKDSVKDLPTEWKMGLAREFEDSVCEVLKTKTERALDKEEAASLIIGGGVSANIRVREELTNVAKERGIPIFLPSRHVSGDNALMIALASAIHIHASTSQSADAKTPGSIRAHGTKRLGE